MVGYPQLDYPGQTSWRQRESPTFLPWADQAGPSLTNVGAIAVRAARPAYHVVDDQVDDQEQTVVIGKT